MNSRLDNLKNSNPVYKDMDDEQILATNYNLYYKDKLSYDSFKQQMTQPLTMQEQNKIALRHYQEKQNITQEDIQNYLNYKETEKLKSKGKIGFWEGFTKINASDFIPFADYVVDGTEAKQMRDIISRAYKGETLSQEETQKLRQFNKELKEDEVRGYTILGSLSSNVGNIIRVPLEFWAMSILTGGLGILAEAGKEATILTKIAYGVVNAGTYTALQSPTAVYSAYQSRQLANMLKITDKGEEFFNKMDNAENFSLKELFKATGDVYVSNATELAGGNLLKGLVAGTGKLANKTTKILLKKDISTLANPVMEKMLPFMKKASQSVFNDSLQNVVAKIGWDGFVEEVFEEWLEQPLRFAIGLEDDKYTFENFLKSMEMSSDEFLITIGAVAIQGGVSYSTAQLYNKLRNKGVDKDKALNHLSTMTEKQKVNYLQQLEKYETEQDTKWYNDYINQLKNDFVKQGETQERVENNLKLLDNVFIRYAINQGTSRKDIVENLILKSNNQNTRLQEQDLINKINNDLLPEFKQTFNKENLNKQDLLNILKSIKEKRATINKDKSKSLIQFLINNGGVFDEKGDLKSQDLNKQYRGLIRDTRFINRKDRKTKENIQYDTSLDNQFKLAWQNGYFPEIQDFRDVDGVNTLINAINEEVGGNARYSSKDTDVNIQTEQAEDFISQLEEAGLDINDLEKLQELDNINKKTVALNQELQNKYAININDVLNDIKELNSLKENINNDKEYQRKRKQENKNKYYNEKENEIIQRIKNKIADWHNASNIDFITSKKGLIDLNNDKAKSIKNEIEYLKEEEYSKKYERIEYSDFNGNKSYELKQKVSNREYDKIEKEYKEKISQKENEYKDYIFSDVLKDYNKYFIYGSNGKGGSYSKYWLLYNKNNNKLLLLRNSNHYDFSNWKHKYEMQDKITEGKFNPNNWEEDNSLMGSGLKKKKNWGSKLENNYNGYAFFEINKNNLQNIFDVDNLYQTKQEYTEDTININGVNKTVYNSNGERIARTKEDLENFYKWFGDSKAVNEKGEPLILYHRTQKGGFEIFNKNSFFSDDKKQAEGYAETQYNKIAEYGKIYSVYLSIQNPLIVDANGHFWNTIEYKGKIVNGEKLSKIAKNKGYDGLIIKNVKDPAQPWTFIKNANDYVTFNSNQIKSVENKGQFSLDKNNIYYQTAYHGSPYNFDKFTLEHIGEGEGVQAYGYGLYFTLNKETAEGYKNTLSKTKKEQGKLYEVEIPNDDVMLFIQKNYNQQSESVKKSIDDIIKKEISQETKNDFEKRYNQNLEYYIKNNDFSNNERINIGFTDIWGALRFFLKDFSDYGEKRTSEIFNKHGIEGIRYKNYRDGECAVVFNDKAISIIEKFNQQQNKDALAQIQFKDTEAIITLFENANASSLTHEMGHYFLRLTQALANSGNVVAQKDLEEIRKWLKNDGTPFTVEQEELFARSYEGYLRRGIAPSSRLQEVFNKLSEWLRDVYKSIKELNINLSRDVIDFFDNYLSYDIDTSNAELQNQINNLQSQMDEEVNTLMQDGMDYNTAYDLVSDKYQERIDRIKQELQDKSRSSKDYDFNKVVLDLKEQENNKLRNYINSSKKAMKDWSVHSLMTTENILKNLAPDLYYKMSKYYASLSINKNDTFKKLEGFFNKLNNIEQENTDDYYILWSALYNRFNDKIQELLDKYNLYDDYIQVREILDDIRLKALSVGVDVSYLENYFPRSLKIDTRNEFLEQLRTDGEGKSIANDILYNLELIRREKGSLDPEQEAKYINNFLRGYVPRDLLPLTVIGNLRKPRKIDIIQPQYLKYYEKPQVALHRYVSVALEDFYKRQLLGMENQDISKLRRRILDLRRSLKTVQETSAGKIKRNVDYKLKFTKLAKEEQVINLLKKNQQDFTQEEKELLIKLNQEIDGINKNIEYNEKANAYAVKNKRIKDIKKEIQENFDKIQNIKVENQEFNLESSIGYLLQNSDTLQNLKQDEIDLVKKAITSQLNPEQTKGFLTKLAIKTSSMALLDITNSINQLKDFANSFAEYGIKNAIKSINSDINIKIEDLGINDIIDNIQQDRWKFLDKMLKLNGLVSIDTMFANQQIRAQFLQTQELLKNNDFDTLREIELFFGNEAQDVINNLKELKNLDDSKIREWAYFKLSQLRPLNSGSKTLLYLTSGRLGRIAYILKNYAIKQLNLAYSRVYREALNGNYKKAATYGTELFLFTLLIAGSIDSAKDLIWGMIFGFDEEPEKYITDAMIDNIILFNLIGRYNVSKVSKEGIGTGFFEFMFMSPLVSISNDVYKDIDKLLQGDLEIQDIRSIKYLPYGKTTKKILQEAND